MTNTTTTEWIEKAKKLAGEYAHCYAFVGDDTMPIKHKELMAHLESVVHIIEPMRLMRDDYGKAVRERDVVIGELRQELASLKARIDGGVRVYANRHDDGYLFVDTCPDIPTNAILMSDDGVEL